VCSMMCVCICVPSKYGNVLEQGTREIFGFKTEEVAEG
jgi:hypothetical protein